MSDRGPDACYRVGFGSEYRCDLYRLGHHWVLSSRAGMAAEGLLYSRAVVSPLTIGNELRSRGTTPLNPKSGFALQCPGEPPH